MSRHYGNGYASAITSAPNGSATSITPASVTGAPATPFDARIRNATLTGDGLHFTKEEIVSVTNIASGVCTITRASEAIWDGTQSAVDFTGGPAILEHTFTAGGIADLATATATRVVYAELGTPPAGSQNLVFDTWYDASNTVITGSGPIAAAIAVLGLAWQPSPGRFENVTSETILLHIGWEMTANASPGGACTASPSFPDFLGNPVMNIPISNTIGNVVQWATIAVIPGEHVYWYQTCAGGGNTPLTYIDVAIMRLA